MKTKKLQKLQKHLKTLTLVITSKEGYYRLELPTNKQDEKRFSINAWQFDCGMPACVAGHAKVVFGWSLFNSWHDKFQEFFDLNEKETEWIVKNGLLQKQKPKTKNSSQTHSRRIGWKI